MDERYLQDGQQFESETAVDTLCNTILANIGVLQQEPVNGTSNPYTLTIDAWVNFYARIYNYAFMAGVTNTLTMLINDEEVFKKSQSGGEITIEHTISGFYKAGTTFKVIFSSSQPDPETSFKVTASPYSLYKMTQNGKEQ